jgi:hypothetical protein
MTRVLGAAATGVVLRLRAIEIFCQNILGATTRLGAVFRAPPNRIHHLLRRVIERKPRQGCVSCIFKLLERLAPSVHRRCAERSVRLGRCEVALNVEGVAGALIEFPIGATIALPAGMIVLFVFAAVGAALNRWARERSGSDLDLGGGLGHLPIEVLTHEYQWRQAKRRAEQRCYLQARGDCA